VRHDAALPTEDGCGSKGDGASGFLDDVLKGEIPPADECLEGFVHSRGVMADAAAFEWLCSELEQASALDRLEARGTVRLALKQAGLDARSVTPGQMGVVVEKVLPAELDSRGVADSGAICSGLLPGLKSLAQQGAGDGGAAAMPDEVFRRLGGGT